MTDRVPFNRNILWVLAALVASATFKWFAIPGTTFTQAFTPAAVIIVGFCWFATAYIAISKFEKQLLGWSMVVLGISAIVFALGWPR
ncbi:hypothetical protein [Ruegeria arenilitoris]|uniref:hypothetical protein n=1 Tax=Ruegeria arenilitoris TaxID=1173585 RepID=UPI001479BBE1|nr:hypothetical protein [Ruegeria arenilitoris]